MSSLKAAIVPVTPYQQNCSLVWCEATHEAFICDPGGDLERIQQAIAELSLKPQAIILTHGHLDHCAGSKVLAKQLDIPIWGPHKEDAFWIEQLPQTCAAMGFPPAESFVPDQWLEEGDVVRCGQIQFDVIHCPGHTPGHVVFYNADNQLALVGDVIFQGSIGRTDFPRGDHQTLINSIRNKLFPLGDNVSFVPGHGPNSSFGIERANNPFVADERFA